LLSDAIPRRPSGGVHAERADHACGTRPGAPGYIADMTRLRRLTLPAAAIAIAMAAASVCAPSAVAYTTPPPAGSATASVAAEMPADDPVDSYDTPSDAGDVPVASDVANGEQSSEIELDIDGLIERLRGTRAIGVFTKLALRNDVESLISDAHNAVENGDEDKLPVLRTRFDGLVMKTLALLDGRDDELARDIYQAREFVWQSILEMQA
jgi:hypothetical protein